MHPTSIPIILCSTRSLSFPEEHTKVAVAQTLRSFLSCLYSLWRFDLFFISASHDPRNELAQDDDADDDDVVDGDCSEETAHSTPSSGTEAYDDLLERKSHRLTD